MYSCHRDPKTAECLLEINVFPREWAPECCVNFLVGFLNKSLQKIVGEAPGNHRSHCRKGGEVNSCFNISRVRVLHEFPCVTSLDFRVELTGLYVPNPKTVHLDKVKNQDLIDR